LCTLSMSFLMTLAVTLLEGDTEVLTKNLSQWHLVYHVFQ